MNEQLALLIVSAVFYVLSRTLERRDRPPVRPPTGSGLASEQPADYLPVCCACWEHRWQHDEPCLPAPARVFGLAAGPAPCPHGEQLDLFAQEYAARVLDLKAEVDLYKKRSRALERLLEERGVAVEWKEVERPA